MAFGLSTHPLASTPPTVFCPSHTGRGFSLVAGKPLYGQGAQAAALVVSIYQGPQRRPSMAKG